MSYNFNEIEAKWQKYWEKNQTFKAANDSEKPKFYGLDMFPYPSGAGLHVGHPLGYIASDIVARFKRHQGFNVLHPQGYDSFGLPAEQYAIQTGQHPANTTKVNIEGCLDKQGNILAEYVNDDGSIKNEVVLSKNNKGFPPYSFDDDYRDYVIKGYRNQLDKIGFSFDWSREVRTSDPNYYKWTQWIFIQLFESWYDKESDKARPISDLIELFNQDGNTKVNAVCDEGVANFSAEAWQNLSDKEQQEILLQYRLTYLAETEVNWCPELGTVLANDEIVNGVSERGGYPVVRKKMKQWSMRISAYAERLLQGLESLDWTESLKETQRNWIGKSVGAIVEFPILTFPEGEEKARPKYMTGGNNSQLLIKKAQENRDKPTEAEAALWSQLRNKNIGYKFRQQHLIGDFIVDFVCLRRKLVIEVDGGIHDTTKEYDQERTKILNEKGFDVIRFKNEEVLGNTEAVLDKISKELESQVFPLGESRRFGIDGDVPPSGARGISVFTTRPDTIFGVTFMTLAPEHELVSKITTSAQKEAVESYVKATAKRSERERMADVKTISGVFTGAYAEHPFTKEAVPIWIGDYVLAGYGTGAVMAVPCGDQRDYDFAKHFNIPIKNIFKDVDISEAAHAGKEGTLINNSDFLNDLPYKKALKTAIYELEKIGQGEGKTNYRLRDAVFSRQRYWGEPFPVYYVNGMPQMIDAEHLPIRLPEIEKYLPTKEGEPPLGRAENWAWDTQKNEVVSNELIDDATVFKLELNTMPGWAGSSWYFFRYMEDKKLDEVFASAEAMQYWQNVDLYIGGSEHGTGHLLYARFWTKFLKDRGLVPVEEPFKKLINQGMILGESALVYRVEGKSTFVSKDLKDQYETQAIHADVSLVNTSNELNIEAFKNWREEFKDAEFITEENGKYIVGREVEKMSKSKYNVVNPDDICDEYGADTLRMYEMFLGPLEQAKPWNTAGITGVHNFLKKLWKLYHSGEEFLVSDEKASPESLKILHKTIKKVTEDIEDFSFNTSVSTFMICVNELAAQKCSSREVLEPLAILVSPYAPHIAEELWSFMGHQESIATAAYPQLEEKFLVESNKTYPVSFNGKMRFTLDLSLDLSKEEIEKAVMADERTQKQLEGRTPKKVIIVPGKIVNIVG
ncbi:leucine--tRNA ligase [Mesonia sp. MT50]|uniref:Leucine--tRNA ligase n=1 Tax=Mesonia profundi TaxID=3070998 RepID=A0ABU0ZXX2_9FLAO|nr:leucine--tRNA ligase [Mesonia profundi]MDQ7916229.1 leucine--tRNA ligase [Mesonia profundi]